MLAEPGGDYLLYQGNQFLGSGSVCVEIIGVPPPRFDCVLDVVRDDRNNTEAVFLPAGTTGNYTITVRAMDICADGLPGNHSLGQPPTWDQDFALFVYNGTE